MSIRFRAVTGTLYHAQSGNPLTGATLKFALTGGFGLTDTHLITDAFVTAITGADGAFSVNLWCDEDALVPIDYAVTLPKESNGQPIDEPEYKGVFSLVYAATPIALSILLTSSVPSPLANALLYAVIDARIIAVGGGGGAVDQTIIDASVRAVSGNAVFDALSIKADLVGGKVPAAQLPSYVDDILEFATVAALPATGETGKVYVITTGTDIDKQYRWSGTAYRILSFEAGGPGGTTTRKLGALHFDATKKHHVNCGQIYKSNVSYNPNFFHEALMAAEYSLNNGYWFSDGYGAAHGGGLHGLADIGGGQYRLTGNIWNGVVSNPDHTTGDYLYYGKAQIYNVVFGYNGTHLYIFVDGVCAGIKAYTAVRLSSAATANPTGASYIGGSEHNNYSGWIFWVRFFETALPVATLDGCFRPELLPRSDVGAGDTAFMMSFDEQKYIYEDKSDGFDNTNTAGARRKRHSGLLSREAQTPSPVQFSGLGDIFAGDNLGYSGSLKDFTDANLPQYDDTLTLAPRPYTGAAPAVPAGLLAFDSFSRADQTMLFHALPSLGSTEGGSLGALPWGSGDGYFHTWGILSGAAFTYHPNQNCELISHAGLGVAREVSIDRLTNGTTGLPREGHEGASGLCYGYVNQGTRGVLTCGYNVAAAAMVIELTETVGGEFNTIFTPASVTAPANFTTITVKVEGTRRRVYTNVSAVALIDINTGNAGIGAATKMGLFGYGRKNCMRFKNFTVKAVAVVVGGANPTADEFVFRARAGVTSQALGIMVQGCATNSTTVGDWATLLTIGGTVNDGVNNSRTITGGIAYPFLRCLVPNGVACSLAEFEFRQAGVKIAPIAAYGDGWFNQPVTEFDFNKALDGDATTFFGSNTGATNAHAGIQVY